MASPLFERTKTSSTWFDGFEQKKALKLKNRQKLGHHGGSSSLTSLPPCSPPERSQQAIGRAQSEPALHEAASPSSTVEQGVGRKELNRQMFRRQREFEKAQERHLNAGRQRGIALSKTVMELVKEEKQEEDTGFWGSHGVPGLHTFLRSKFGSIYAGWRDGMGATFDAKMSSGQFTAACRQMGIHGDFKKLWADLDQDLTGFITLNEIDAEVAHIVGLFRKAAFDKYGGLLEVWLRVLDPKQRGRIDVQDMHNCCVELGLPCWTLKNSQTLFSFLKNNQEYPFMTLKEFDPEAHSRFVSGEYDAEQRKVVAASMSPTSQGMSTKKSWNASMFSASQPSSSAGMSQSLPPCPSEMEGAVATMSVRDTKAFERSMKLAQRHTSKYATKPDTWLHSTWGGILDKQAKPWDNPHAQVPSKLKCDVQEYKPYGIRTVGRLKAQLERRKGTILRAWRELLDPDGNDSVTFAEFCRALDKHGFAGNVTELWNCLTEEEREHVELRDLDPKAAEAYDELRQKLSKKWGNMMLAWLRGLHPNELEVVNKADFLAACKDAGVEADVEMLWDSMRGDKGMRLEDFDVKAYQAYHAGDFRQLTGQPAEKSMANFYDRQFKGDKRQIQNAYDLAKSEEFALSCRFVPPSAIKVVKPMEFQEVCIRKYGSVVQAWRQCIDPNREGLLSWEEFCSACGRLGYAGDLKQIWDAYAVRKYKDERGYIKLSCFDPENEALCVSFTGLIRAKYRALEQAWRESFDKNPPQFPYKDLEAVWREVFKKDPHLSVSRKEFVAACAEMDFQGDANKLFDLLRPDVGKKHLFMWDIDPDLSWEQARGHGIYTPRKTLADKEYGQDVLKELELPQLLRTTMIFTYGTTVAAWRAVFDPKLQGEVYLATFMQSLGKIGFKGNQNLLWKELTFMNQMHVKLNGKVRPQFECQLSFATFANVDQPMFKLLGTMRDAFVSKFGSITAAWEQALDVVEYEVKVADAVTSKADDANVEADASPVSPSGGSPSAASPTNLPSVTGDSSPSNTNKWDAPQTPATGAKPAESGQSGAAGATDPEVTATAARIKTKPGCGFVSEKVFSDMCVKNGFEFDAKQAFYALLCSVAGPQGGHQGRLVLEDMKSLLIGVPAKDKQQDEVWGKPLSPQPLPPRGARDHIAKVSTEFQKKCLYIQTLDAFKAKCVEKYGSMWAAWTRLLDSDHNGVVSYNEFAGSCRDLGVLAVKPLWDELIKERKVRPQWTYKEVTIHLKHWDPNLAKAFRTFEKLLVDRYGNTQDGWQQHFVALQGQVHTIAEAIFVKQAAELGYGSEDAAKTLFKMLRPDNMRLTIVYEDLWPSKKAKGQEKAH
eukprot:TRINITY_DN111225_c0_g1_i1.p1 TRINITY_DN111225_c0_g1~~TRINITY_DN111225_c0_g1_i1.p1  ORF type:complete len:1336 (-),score=384.12 TRINITY_DN111225_c0_g1_i1:407-4414(-)